MFNKNERSSIHSRSNTWNGRTIPLGLTVVSYPKRIKWSLELWLWVLLITIAFLGIGVAINYGPF